MFNLNMNNMKRTTLILLSLLLLNLMGLYAQKYDVSVQKIWDNGSHTAFTSEREQVVALSFLIVLLQLLAIISATVVLPVPGGP